MLPAILAAITLAVQLETDALTLALGGRPVVISTLAQDALTAARQNSLTHATVRVAYAEGASAVYTYELNGSDCTLDYAFTNPSGQPGRIDLSGWTCTFAPGATLTGTLPYWRWAFYAAREIWHPSFLSPVGAVYAADVHMATVFYSPSEWDHQSLLNAT